MKKLWHGIFIVCLLFVVQGCATTQQSKREISSDEQIQTTQTYECWLMRMDQWFKDNLW